MPQNPAPSGGLDEFLGQRHEVVAEEKGQDRHAEDRMHDDQPAERAVDLHLAQPHQLREERQPVAHRPQQQHDRIEHHLIGDEGADQQDGKEQVGALEAPVGDGIARHARHRDRDEDRGDQDADRVPEPAAEPVAVDAGAGLGPGLDPVLKGDLLRHAEHVALPDFIHVLERGHDHDPERQQEIQGKDAKRQVERDVLGREGGLGARSLRLSAGKDGAGVGGEVSHASSPRIRDRPRGSG